MINKKKRWFSWPLKKGQEREIQDIQDRIEARPDDPWLHQKLAEIYLENGDKLRAIEQFIMAAECNSDAGFYLRAIALYRRILRIDKESREVIIRLAELYLLNGLLGDAIVHFRKAVDFLRKAGEEQEIPGLLKRMIEIEPEDLDIRDNYIEALRSEGFLLTALEELSVFLEEARQRGQTDQFERLVAKIKPLYLECKKTIKDPAEIEALSALESKLKTLAESKPTPLPTPSKEPEILEMESAEVGKKVADKLQEEPEEIEPVEEAPLEDIAPVNTPLEISDTSVSAAPPTEIKTTYVRLRSGEETSLKLKEVMLYTEQGLLDEAEFILDEILENDPNNPDALQALERLNQKRRSTLNVSEEEKQAASKYTLVREDRQGEPMQLLNNDTLKPIRKISKTP